MPSSIYSQFLWYNSQILIENKSVHFKCFSIKNVNFVKQLFNTDGTLKKWDHFKQEYNLQDANKFQWIQLVHAIPNNWKNIIVNDKGDSFNLAIENHHLIKKNLILCIEKLESKELYFMQILSQYTTPSSQIYFENLFQEKDFEWNKIYLLPRLITVDSAYRVFHYKILRNVLFLNQKLFLFQKVNSPLCSFCNNDDETVKHLFHSCPTAIGLWNNLRNTFREHLQLPDLTPQSAIFGFLDTNHQHNLIFNHLLLIFKFYLYKARDHKKTNIKILKDKIKNIRTIELSLARKSINKSKKYKKKWKPFENISF